MRITLSILLLLSFSFSNGQNLKVLKPTLGNEINYSNSDYEYWKKASNLMYRLNNPDDDIDYLKMDKENQVAIDSLEMGHGPMTEGVACSWYCGGGPYKITSSSILNNNDKYSEKNTHDFDLLKAWAPKSKNGIGESLNFHFKGQSPRVTAIIIYSGYLKTKELWKSNSRAKKIKLKIDNKTMAILELEDTTASQRFEIEPIQSKIKDQDLILTLEIMESYEGEKYTDLVISEVNFDGIDVH